MSIRLQFYVWCYNDKYRVPDDESCSHEKTDKVKNLKLKINEIFCFMFSIMNCDNGNRDTIALTWIADNKQNLETTRNASIAISIFI